MPNFFQQVEKFAGFKTKSISNQSAEIIAIRAKKAITLKQAEDLAKRVMRCGEGNDNTTLLNRSMNSVRGSRRTNSAL
jgi:hypothetical protein